MIYNSLTHSKEYPDKNSCTRHQLFSKEQYPVVMQNKVYQRKQSHLIGLPKREVLGMAGIATREYERVKLNQ